MFAKKICGGVEASQVQEFEEKTVCFAKAPLTFETACRPENPTSSKDCQTEGPWNIIIVNQLPTYLDYEKLISVFSQYGQIESTYLCRDNWKKSERLARVTFSNEEDAWKVWEASQKKLIKYDDDVLMITVASDNYSPIENLPDICLREIFQRVNSIVDKFNVEMVCKRWRDNGRCCWSNITNCHEQYWKFDTLRVILSRAGNSLEDFQFNSIYENTPECLRIVAEHCVRLKRFTCEFGGEEDYAQFSHSMHTILQKNTNLRRLQVYIDSPENPNMDFMEVLPAKLVKIDIRTLDRQVIPPTVALSKFQNLRDLLLRSLIITNPHQTFDNVVNLEKLALVDCHIPESIISTMLRNNKGLKYLDIGLDYLTDASLKYIQQLPKLEALVIGTKMFADAHLGNMPRLKGLICQCPLITDQGIRNFFDSAADIEQMSIVGCLITLQSITIARDWTKRTGKCLKLAVDFNLFDQYAASKCQDTENFKVVDCHYDDHHWLHADMADTLLLEIVE